MLLIINTPQTEQLLVQVQPGMFGRGKNVYNLIPIRNTGSKVKENVSCKRSNKHTRNTSFWAATRPEKRLQDLCNQIALSPGDQMAPVISSRLVSQEWQTTWLPALCLDSFYIFFFVLLAHWTKPHKPCLCLRSNHSLFLHRNGEEQKEKSASSTKCFLIQPNSCLDIYEQVIEVMNTEQSTATERRREAEKKRGGNLVLAYCERQ